MSLERHQNIRPLLGSSRDFSTLKRAKVHRPRNQQQQQHHHHQHHGVPNIRNISSTQLLEYASQLTHKNLRRTSSQPEMTMPRGRYQNDSQSSPTSPLLPRSGLDYNSKQQHPNGNISWARKASFDSTTSSFDDECSLYSYYNSDTDDGNGTTSESFNTMYEIIQRKLQKHLRHEEIFSNREIQKVCQELRRRALVMELQDGWQSSLSDVEVASGMNKEVLEAIYLLRNAHKSDLFPSQESLDQTGINDKSRSVGCLDIESTKNSTRQFRTGNEVSAKRGSGVLLSDHNKLPQSNLDRSASMTYDGSKRQRRLRSDDVFTTSGTHHGIRRSENSDPVLTASFETHHLQHHQQQLPPPHHLQTLSKSSDRIQHEIYDFQNKLAHQSSPSHAPQLFHNHRHRPTPVKIDTSNLNRNISTSAPNTLLDDEVDGINARVTERSHHKNYMRSNENTDMHTSAFSSTRPKEHAHQSLPDKNDKDEMNFEDSNPTYKVFAEIFQQSNTQQSNTQPNSYNHDLPETKSTSAQQNHHIQPSYNRDSTKVTLAQPTGTDQFLQGPDTDFSKINRSNIERSNYDDHSPVESILLGMSKNPSPKPTKDGRNHRQSPHISEMVANNFTVPRSSHGDSLTVGKAIEDGHSQAQSSYTSGKIRINSKKNHSKLSSTTESNSNKSNVSESDKSVPVEEVVESIVVSTAETTFESEPPTLMHGETDYTDDEMVIIPQQQDVTMANPPSSQSLQPASVSFFVLFLLD